jgi:hypothetical protein
MAEPVPLQIRASGQPVIADPVVGSQTCAGTMQRLRVLRRYRIEDVRASPAVMLGDSRSTFARC